MPPTPPPQKSNALEKSASQYERKLARQRQLELMEATASGTAPSMELDIPAVGETNSGMLRMRNQEAARRFLSEEDEEEHHGLSQVVGSKLFAQPSTPVARSNVNLMDHDTGIYQEKDGGFFHRTVSSIQTAVSNFWVSPQQQHHDAFVRATESGEYYLGRADVADEERNKRLSPIAAACKRPLSEWQSMPSKRRRLLTYAIAALAIATLIIMTLSITVFGKMSEEHLRKVNTKRFNEILDHIIMEGISRTDVFLNPSSAEHKALRWISYSDPAHLDPMDPNILQRYALAVFYYQSYMKFQSIAGRQKPIEDGDKQFEGVPNPGWIRKDYWMTGVGYCNWYGIRCASRLIDGVPNTSYDGNDKITSLNLTSNHVYGIIPPEFKAFEDLHVLDLSHNRMTGTIPYAMARGMYQTNYLKLQNNEFTGKIPDSFGFMGGVRDIHLSYNKLSGPIPSELNRLYNLRSLGLDNNKLSGKIPDLSMCRHLTQVFLNDNQLTGRFPFGLTRVTTLFEIYMQNNKLSGTLPPEIEGLRHLEYLHLEGNQMTGTLPDHIFTRLSYLRELQVNDNKFTGDLPLELGKLEQLRLFKAHNNDLTGGIPVEWTRMRGLTTLHLYNNRLQGSIPTSIGTMTHLLELWLHNNSMHGSIPTEIGKCKLLQTMYLENNYLDGHVPTEIGALTHLRTLRLFNNKVTGTVPSEVCQLTKTDQLSFFETDCNHRRIDCDCCKCH